MNILNLLVIEDYPPDVVILKAYLEEASFRHNFFHSSTLQEGFEILRENQIDLVLLDLSLADSAGFNTLKKYLEESPEVPVIVMTGLKNEVVGTQSVRAGAQDYLIKGNFDSKSLVQRLRYSLERWKNNSRLQKVADELKEIEKRSKATFDLVKIGSWEMDIVGRSMKWNEGMYKIFGFQPNSLSPTLSDYMNYVHFEDRSKVDAFFDKVIQGSVEPRLEHRIIVNGTNIRHLAINARVNIKGDLDKIMLIGTVQDITDRRKGLENNDHQEKQVLESDFFGHLVPPLQPALSPNLFSLLANLAPAAGNAPNDTWKEEIKTLVHSYYQLLQFALFQNSTLRSSPVQVRPAEIIRAIQDFSSNILGASWEKTKLQPAPSLEKTVYIDPNWLFQLVYAFFLAADYERSRTHEMMFDFDIEKADNTPGSLVMTVKGKFKKSGILNSFTERSLIQDLDSKASQPAETIHLLMILKIIRHLGGSYKVKMLPNAGQKFVLHLPLEAPPVVLPTKGNDQKVANRINHILIVEDHSITRIRIKKMLNSWSGLVKIQVAENGQEAVEIADRTPFDLIVMDLKMPVMDGIEATGKIRNKSKVPIIAMTNHHSDQEKAECYASGADAYLAKPLNAKELHETLSTLLSPQNATVV